ncbi:FMRFamide peptide receptor frpr-18-like [Haliotis rufescens]|uniref:FMRFamide peptide receptor frpr-18-like n=1 Tax=Haliotis rufescens TaxID=6454 RepID=UPI001EB05DB1|nr:FMRFamide peptide receptor frpr-18-like [Haliotis rufescens]
MPMAVTNESLHVSGKYISNYSLHRNKATVPNDDMVDEATSEFIINISSCGLVPVITILGIIGNIMSFVVFLRQKKRDRTRVVLISLAISDTMYLLITFVRKMSCVVSMFDEVIGKNWGVFMVPQWYIIGITFARVTSVLTMVIAIERCFAVLFPLKVRAVVTRARALKLVIAIFIMVSVAMFPLTLCSYTRWTLDPVQNRSVLYVTWTDFYIKNEGVMENYINIALATLLRITPCIVVLFCTTAVLASLKRGQKFRKQSSNMAKSGILMEERRVTVMLLAVTSVYVICLVPGSVLVLMRRFVPSFSRNGRYNNMFLLLSNMNIVLECLNSALNFVIYMKTNRRFNIAFKKMFCSSCNEKTLRNELHLLSNGTSATSYLD